MDLEQKPSWSKGDLRRLGEALVIDKAAAPDGCPLYDDVMRWHNDLAAEVAGKIQNTPWVAVPPDQMSVTARAKTVDTLVQKLQRTTLKLGDVQDLAGVRIDADIVLTQQTNLAQEIAEHFGAPPRAIKDIRPNPHSGYRAVHVVLTLPAGRAEVQIRTLVQSEWANAYEGIGEVVGRGIRYNETHENANVRTLVDGMQTISTMIAEQEVFTDKMWQLDQGIKSLSPPTTAQQAEVLERIAPVFEQHERRYADSRAQVADMVEKLRVVRTMITGQEV
jgi:ppGpp synthetase/RelA/SpoT-type nucleotidyltranferase